MTRAIVKRRSNLRFFDIHRDESIVQSDQKTAITLVLATAELN